jgi:hypothetical protein
MRTGVSCKTSGTRRCVKQPEFITLHHTRGGGIVPTEDES